MNKKMVKLVSVVFVALMIISVASSAFALTPNDITSNNNVAGTNEITSIGQNIVGILQTIGVVISVVVLIVLGIKYMTGSAEEKAEYKKTLLPYLIGALLIFAASVFANMVYEFATGIK